MKAEHRTVFRDMIKRRTDAIPVLEARILEIGIEQTRDPWEGHVAHIKRLESRLARYRQEVEALEEVVRESSRYGH